MLQRSRQKSAVEDIVENVQRLNPPRPNVNVKHHERCQEEPERSPSQPSRV
jgi:hypothetical protein